MDMVAALTLVEKGEIKKLEIEFCGTNRSQVTMVPATLNVSKSKPWIRTHKIVAQTKTEKVDKLTSVGGLPDNIYEENVKSGQDQADDSSRNNHGHQQQPFKRQNVAKVYNMGTCEKKPYGGSLPKEMAAPKKMVVLSVELPGISERFPKFVEYGWEGMGMHKAGFSSGMQKERKFTRETLNAAL
ncbi:hypothetical protein Tco_1448674 [Tanacetum coccineum]